MEKEEGRKRLEEMIEKGELKGIIFDLDGTLLRSDVAFGPYRERLGIKGDVIAGIQALNSEEQGKKWEIIGEYEKELERCSHPAPGAERLLSLLLERGIKTGVITRSTGRHARILLERHNLKVGISIGREDTRPKPHPDGISYLLDMLGIGPKNAIMVGDFLWDILAGREAGLLTVLVVLEHSLPYIREADVVMESLNELCELLE